MNDEAAFAEARQRRTEAWARVNEDVSALRAGLSERPIATRLKDHAADRALNAVDTAKAIALANPMLIAGLVAALAGWMLRRPLGSYVQSWLGR